MQKCHSEVRLLCLCLALALPLATPSLSHAQTDGYLTNSNLRGIIPFGSYQFGEIDNINLGTGTVNLRIPLYSRPGRGTFFGGQLLVYSSKIWRINPSIDPLNPDLTKGFAWELTDRYLPAIIGVKGVFIDWTEQVYECVHNSGSPPGEGPGGSQEQFWVTIKSNYISRAPDRTETRFPNRKVTVVPEHLATFVEDCGLSPWDYTVELSESGVMELDTSQDNPVLRFKNGEILQWGVGGSYVDANGNTGDGLEPGASAKDSSGTALDYTFQAVSVTISPEFPTVSCGTDSPVYQLSRNISVPTTLTLPNGQTFGFAFSSSGELIRIDLPTGGYIRYEYAEFIGLDNGPAGPPYLLCPIDSRRVIKRHVSVDGVTEKTWTYAYTRGGTSLEYTTTVTDPLGNVSIHKFFGKGFYEWEKEIRAGSSTPVRKVANDWSWDFGPVAATQGETVEIDTRNARLTSTETTLLDSNQVTKVVRAYDSYTYAFPWPNSTSTYNNSRMNIVETQEYDYGDGAPGPLVRKTTFTYLHDSDTTYLDRHILDRVTSRKVYAGSATTPTAETLFSYDTTPLTATSGAYEHDDVNYPSSLTLRGNLTEEKVWRNTDGAWLIITHWYDDLGNRIQTQDPLGHTTTFDYTDSWQNSVCAPPTGQARVFPTKITNHLGQFTTTKYYSCTGLAAEVTDPNIQTTTFTYDFFDRPTSANRPDGGWTTHTFNDAARKVTRSAAIDSTLTATVGSPTTASRAQLSPA